MQQTRNLFGCQVFDSGDVPDGWVCVPLGERIELAYGHALEESQRQAGKVAVFGSNGPVGTHNEPLCAGPGVLVGRKGTVGAVHYTDQPFWPIDTVYYVVPLEPDDMKFLYYLLQYLPLKNLNAATGVPGLSRRDAYALRGVFPPMEEQGAIARMLTTADDAIGAVAGLEGRRLSQGSLFGEMTAGSRPRKTSSVSKLAALIELRKSLLHGLLTGRLDTSLLARVGTL